MRGRSEGKREKRGEGVERGNSKRRGGRGEQEAKRGLGEKRG